MLVIGVNGERVAVEEDEDGEVGLDLLELDHTVECRVRYVGKRAKLVPSGTALSGRIISNGIET